MKTMDSDLNPTMKYLQLRKNFIKMFREKTPTADFTNQEKVERAIFALNKIYFDEETPTLFKQLMPYSDITKTIDFLEFLKKITENE